MGRAKRVMPAGMVFHLLNRAHESGRLFGHDGDYKAFEGLLEESLVWCRDRGGCPIRLYAYCLMPNHWHLLASSETDQGLVVFIQRLTAAHVRRWRKFHGSSGRGVLYQGRFRSFPVQEDGHFATVASYIEANARRSNLVDKAEDWKWGSLSKRLHRRDSWLSSWPIPRPPHWVEQVNAHLKPGQIEVLRTSIQRGRPYGVANWCDDVAQDVSLESTLKRKGRPMVPK